MPLGPKNRADSYRHPVNQPQLRWIANFIWKIADDVLEMKPSFEKVKIIRQDQALRQVVSHAFYKTSKITLRGLKAAFGAHLDGFSPNVQDRVKGGYEISLRRYFYKPQLLRTLEESCANILALEKETEGLLGGIVAGSAP